MTRFYTYKKQVPLRAGERIGYLRGRGYFARPAPTQPPVAAFSPVMFTAQDPLAVLNHPWPGRVALSADHAFRDAVLDALPALRGKGFRLYAWCDCKPGRAVRVSPSPT